MRDKSPQVREAVVAVLTEAWTADAHLTREFLERWRGKGAPALLRELVLPG